MGSTLVLSDSRCATKLPSIGSKLGCGFFRSLVCDIFIHDSADQARVHYRRVHWFRWPGRAQPVPDTCGGTGLSCSAVERLVFSGRHSSLSMARRLPLEVDSRRTCFWGCKRAGDTFGVVVIVDAFGITLGTAGESRSASPTSPVPICSPASALHVPASAHQPLPGFRHITAAHRGHNPAGAGA